MSCITDFLFQLESYRLEINNFTKKGLQHRCFPKNFAIFTTAISEQQLFISTKKLLQGKLIPSKQVHEVPVNYQINLVLLILNLGLTFWLQQIRSLAQDYQNILLCFTEKCRCICLLGSKRLVALKTHSMVNLSFSKATSSSPAGWNFAVCDN